MVLEKSENFEIEGSAVTIKQAAWMVRKTPQTIRNAKNGKIKDRNKALSSKKGIREGREQDLIEIVELERVFGKLRFPSSFPGAPASNQNSNSNDELSDSDAAAGIQFYKAENQRLEKELEDLKIKTRQTQDKLDDITAERDRWHQAFNTEQENAKQQLKLLPAMAKTSEESSAHQKELLASVNKLEKKLEEKPKKGLFGLFGS